MEIKYEIARGIPLKRKVNTPGQLWEVMKHFSTYAGTRPGVLAASLNTTLCSHRVEIRNIGDVIRFGADVLEKYGPEDNDWNG